MRRLKRLKKTRLASVEHFKRQKLSQIFLLSNTKQPRIDNTESNIVDMNNTEDKVIWFWNKSVNKTESDLEGRGKSDIEKSSLDQALVKIKEVVLIQNC